MKIEHHKSRYNRYTQDIEWLINWSNTGGPVKIHHILAVAFRNACDKQKPVELTFNSREDDKGNYSTISFTIDENFNPWVEGTKLVLTMKKMGLVGK